MPKEYVDDLKGTREKALAAAEDILKNMTRYGGSGHKEAARHQMQFAFMVLRNICVAMQAPAGVHYDIYCDIFERTLAPTMQPTVSPAHWSKSLEMMRYLHYLMLDRKLYKEAAVVCKFVAGQAMGSLQNDGDHKFILSLYFQHLLVQRNHMQSDVACAHAEIDKVLGAITATFEQMLRCNRELNLQYGELLPDFVQWIMPKMKSSQVQYLNSLPDKKTRMFEAFFQLLAGLKAPPTREPAAAYEQHIDAAFVFLQLDMGSVKQPQQQQQLVMQHLRVCRDLELLQQDQMISYVISLLFYYVKFVYSQARVKNFAATYSELCGKFTKFFVANGETLMQQRWFAEALVWLHLLLAQVHQQAATMFAVFWQQMTTWQCFGAHFELLLASIKLAPHIGASKLVSWQCCTSVRKHFILATAQIALSAYATLLLKMDSELEAVDRTVEDGVNRCCLQILSHSFNVMDSMTCINGSSADLKMFYARYAQLTRDIRTAAQARCCLTIAKLFVKIRTKFASKDWLLLVRRIYKTAALTGDRQLEAELHACYIAIMVQDAPAALDSNLLHNQIVLFYANAANVTHGKCLLALLQHCSSALRPQLTAQQQRLLYYMDAQHFLRYLKTPGTPLHLSFLASAPTEYEFVLTARLGCDGNAQKTDDRLHEICQRYQRKAGARFTRLEQLVYGHACAVRLQQQVEQQKQSMTFDSKDCAEEKLEELLVRKELPLFNVASEWRFIKMAERVIHAFEQFYSRADAEPIGSDVAYIDWEHLLDDLISTAQFVQVAGYMNYATQAWLLVYRIANTLDDQMNALRALTFCCEHPEYFIGRKCDGGFDLATEVDSKLPILVTLINDLQPLLRRQQTFVLTCLCQLAYYYASAQHFTYAQLLLDMVQQKHAALPERRGKYDLVLGSLHAVKFRILWQYQDVPGDGGELRVSPLLKACLLREIEDTMDSFRDFSYISACDSMPYVILLHSLTLQFAECAANRLCDSIVKGFLVCVLRTALQMGLALRVVQTLTMWIWTNLQMEHIDKAQVKLKLIDILMGKTAGKTADSVKGVTGTVAERPLTAKKCQQQLAVSVDPALEILTALHANPGMESVRKVAQIHLSPIQWKQNELSPNTRGRDLQSFLHFRNASIREENELVEWTYFTVGCLTARLHFLVADYKQLDTFYTNSQKWLQEKLRVGANSKAAVFACNFKNFDLLRTQHYVNYLRATGKYERALKCLVATLDDNTGHWQPNVDAIYRINFQLQLSATNKEISTMGKENIRRALDFNTTSPPAAAGLVVAPTKDLQSEQLQRKEATVKVVAPPAKKFPSIKHKLPTNKRTVPFTIYNSPQTQAKAAAISKRSQKKAVALSSPEQPSDNSVDDDLNMCQLIDIIDLDDTVAEVVTTKLPTQSTIKDKVSAATGTLVEPKVTAAAVAATKVRPKKSKSQSSSRSTSPDPQPPTPTKTRKYSSKNQQSRARTPTGLIDLNERPAAPITSQSTSEAPSTILKSEQFAVDPTTETSVKPKERNPRRQLQKQLIGGDSLDVATPSEVTDGLVSSVTKLKISRNRRAVSQQDSPKKMPKSMATTATTGASAAAAITGRTRSRICKAPAVPIEPTAVSKTTSRRRLQKI